MDRCPRGSKESEGWRPPLRYLIRTKLPNDPKSVRERLVELFGQGIIAFNHEVEWPQRSHDLTPCDIFLWGYLESRVYTSPQSDCTGQQRLQGQEICLWDTSRTVWSTNNSPQSWVGMATKVPWLDALWHLPLGIPREQGVHIPLPPPPPPRFEWLPGAHSIWDQCSSSRSCFG